LAANGNCQTELANDEDGFRLADSEAIAEYIDETHPEPPMLPLDAKVRARAREVSRFHDTRLEPVLRGFFPHVALSKRDPVFIVENAALLQKRLDQLAQMATPQPLLFGDGLSIADCGFVASFALIRVLQGILGFTLEIPATLQRYEAALTAHPAAAEESKAYFKALEEWARTKQHS